MILAILLMTAQAGTGQCEHPVAPGQSAATGQRTESSEKESKGPWFTNDQYPPDARRAHQQGTVWFTLDIDTRGCPAACHVTKSSGHKLLDDATCPILMRRARFRPAVDAAGTPIAAPWSNKFKWALD